MKTSTLFAVYREAVARRDIAGTDVLLWDESGAAKERYAKIVRQCDKLDKAITRRIVAMETAGEGGQDVS